MRVHDFDEVVVAKGGSGSRCPDHVDVGTVPQRRWQDDDVSRGGNDVGQSPTSANRGAAVWDSPQHRATENAATWDSPQRRATEGRRATTWDSPQRRPTKKLHFRCLQMVVGDEDLLPRSVDNVMMS